MATIADYYEYAKLASAAYIQLEGVTPDASAYPGSAVAALANEQDGESRLPLALADQEFRKTTDNPNPWVVPSFGANGSGYFGNDAEGFAATLFERTNEDGGVDKVLAIRGTEPETNEDLYKADIGQIRFPELALRQPVWVGLTKDDQLSH